MTLVVGGGSTGPTDLEAAAEEAISLASDGMKLQGGSRTRGATTWRCEERCLRARPENASLTAS